MSIKLADAFIEVIMDYAKAEKDAGQMEKRIGGLTSGTIAKLSAGMLAAGAAITGTLGVATAKAASFGELLANVATLGVKDLGALDAGTRDLAVKFGLDLNDAIQVTYDTLSAGIPENAAIMVMEKAALGAQAGVGSLSEAMDLGTSAMNAWNLKSADANVTTANFEKIMGQAATAVKAGKTTIAEMAQSIGMVAPLMAEAGVSTDEFFAAVSALTATGLPASQAMTSMRAAISNIIKPGAEAKETAESLGIQFDAAALQSQGLAQFLQTVSEATGGNIDTMGKLFGSVEGLGSIMSLTGTQAENFKNILGEMGNAQQNLNDMSDAYIKNNPKLAFDQAKAALQELFILVGRSVIPALTGIVRVASPIMRGISWFIQENPKISMGIFTIVGAIGLLLIGLGSLAYLLAGLAPLWIAHTAATAAAGTAAAASGTAAAAGSVGFWALAASIGGALLAALPFIAIAAALGAALYFVVPAVIETVDAYKQLEESTKNTDIAFEKFIDTLIAQGVELDKAALMEMEHAERSAAITAAQINTKEAAMAREIRAITGVGATRDQIHRAEMARVGLQISRHRAAVLAIEGISAQEIRARMATGQATEAVEETKQQATQETFIRAKEELYKDLDTTSYGLKVKGNAYEKAARYEAQVRREHKERTAAMNKQLEEQMGKDNLSTLETELAKTEEVTGLRKASEEEVFNFKQQLLQKDLDGAMNYWGQMREQTANGLDMNLQEWQAYSASVQQEMANLRQAAAYAMNPAQTGSPSLNQEMAAGFETSEAIVARVVSRMQGMFDYSRDAAHAALVGMGARMIGSRSATPTAGDMAGASASVSAARSGSSSANQGAAPITISAPVTISGNNYNVPSKEVAESLAKGIARQVSREIGDQVLREIRGSGIRRPSVNLGISVQPT